MVFFSRSKSGGFMDEIRCDESSYLIWKWHPKGSQQGNNNRENAIRWGSSLRVKEGELAIFVYNKRDGLIQDFIEGPYDQILKTENLPVLSSIVGLAYEGGTPFQAEVYFINLAEVIQIPFAVPFFDVYDPRFLDFGVPTAVRGKITFNIADYREFIKINRLSNFDLNAFQTQIKDAMARYVKGIVANVPAEKNIPIVQIEREILRINELVEVTVRERFEKDFGVNITAVDINAIEVDKTSEGCIQLKKVTQDIATATAQAQNEINIKNTEESIRIQREEGQYAQRKQTESVNFAAYQLEKQSEVGIAGANALGQMGTNGATEMSGGDGMNMAGLMVGMAMGGAVGQNLAGMMNNMMGGVQQGTLGRTPPPINTTSYHVAVNDQAIGPFDIDTLTQMANSGTFTRVNLVWKQGMANWVAAESVQELQIVFGEAVPPIPPIPPTV